MKPEYYNNDKGSLYKFCEDHNLNSYEFDIIKRVMRCRKKGNFVEDIDKTIFLLNLYKEEHEELDNKLRVYFFGVSYNPDVDFIILDRDWLVEGDEDILGTLVITSPPRAYLDTGLYLYSFKKNDPYLDIENVYDKGSVFYELENKSE